MHFAARTHLGPNTKYIIRDRMGMRGPDGDRIASVETYYTDATGTVTRVDTFAGVRRAWSPELQKPVPGVTYNVIAEVDGGLQNTFTYTYDDAGHLAHAEGHITSTFTGTMNRNAYQQLLAGRAGGPGYDGGHATPSSLGGIGEKAGLFPQYEWQNRGTGHGTANDSANFRDTERDIAKRVKRRIANHQPVDLHWEMNLIPGQKPGLPDHVELRHWFGNERGSYAEFNNLQNHLGEPRP